MTNPGVESSVREAVWKGGFIIAAAFVMTFVFNLLRLTGPLFMLLIYDRVLPSRSEETLVALFAVLVTFVVAMGLIDYSRRRILARFGAQFQERIENRLFTATSRTEFFVRTRSKPTAGLDELDGLRNFFHSGALISIFDFIWMPMFVVMVFVLHWMLGWVCIGGMAVLLVLLLVKTLFAGAKEERAKAATGKINGLKDLMMSSRDVIRGQEMAGSVKERWLAARQQSRDKAIELKDWTAWFEIFSRQSGLLLRYSVLAVGAYYTLQGTLTVGAMVAAMFLVSRVFSSTETFLNNMPVIMRASVQWKDLKKILAAKSAEQSDPCSEALPDVRAQLALSNVSVRSPVTGELILRSLKLTIGSGKLLEIIGESGAGKTILAETILGGWKTSSGIILFGGINIERLTEQETAAIFGYVPEVPAFVAGTIEENISRLEVAPNREKVITAAKLAQVHDMIMALPDGYQTQMDAAGNSFARGERARLAFARALYTEPKVLIIDEPDTSLRQAMSKSLRSVMGDLKSRGTVIIILSREKLSLPMSSGQLLLEGGRLKQIKTPDNVTKLSDKSDNNKVSSIVRN